MPDSVPATSSQDTSFNPAQVLQQVLGQNQEQLNELARKASIPIAGGHATGFPASMDPTPKTFTPTPLDTRPVVGAGNAKGQGITNAIVATTNLLGRAETEVQNKKKLEIASATQQLLTAQQAHDQAVAALKADPNNADAKAAIDRNKAVMNGILANDKIRKAIAKGFNVDFTDPQANNTLEHQGVAQGKKMATEHADYAEQFNQKTPIAMVPNTMAQQQLAVAQATQKANTEATKALVPLLSATIRANTAASIEDKKAQTAAVLETFRADQAWNRVQAQIAGRQDLARTQYGYKLSEISAEGSKDLAVFKAKLSAKNADPLAQVKAYEDFQTKTATTQASLEKHVSDLQIARDQLAKAKPYDAASVSNLDQQLSMAKQAQQAYKDSSDSIQKFYTQISGAEKGGSSNGNSNTSTPIDSSARYLSDSATDDEDPEY